MTFLTIVDRELSVTARNPRAWWRRVGVAGASVFLFGFIFLTLRAWGPTFAGSRLFQALGLLGMIYAMVAGTVVTADAISREKRQGTLGLLFLTDLTGFDVVLGKIAALSIDLVLGIAAVLPIMAIPMLFGGVGLGRFVGTALSLFALLFLSLAVGACASAVCTSGRVAFATALLFLALLTFAIPAVADGLFGIAPYHPLGKWVYSFCPLWTFIGTFETAGTLTWQRWVNLGGIHALSWVMLLIACKLTSHSRVERPGAGFQQLVLRQLQTIQRGSQRFRTRWRDRMLEANPVAWLLGRDRSQHRLIWTVVLFSTAIWLIKHVETPARWPDGDLAILWPFFSHYTFCLWIAIEAPRRLIDDKESGALELLLCTPVPPEQILSGCKAHLRRLFVRPLLFLLLFYIYGVLALLWFSTAPGNQEIYMLAVRGIFVIPVQVYTLFRVGLYQGLVSGNSIKATVWLVAKVCVLPYVLFVGWMVFCEEYGRAIGFPRLTQTFVFNTWAIAHLLANAALAIHANSRLLDFRTLAARTTARPWWKRVVGLTA